MWPAPTIASTFESDRASHFTDTAAEAPGAHDGVVGAVADREREAGLGMRVDQDREDGRQVEALAVALADRDPLAGRGLRLLDVGGHRLPLARELVEHDVALGIHVEAALAVHPVGLLDAGDVLGRRHEPHHVRAAQDQGLAVPPALVHSAILIQVSAAVVTTERSTSAERIARDIETLSGPDFTLSSEAIRRYAYTPVYRNTSTTSGVRWTSSASRSPRIRSARSSPATGRRGEPAFGIGSHCDSNRNGGRYDGTMGVVTALEVCRLNAELGLGLPLQLISFLEEEGSGFGQMLLGSRIMAQRVTEDELRERFRAIDDGRSFWEHADGRGLRARALARVRSMSWTA